MLEGLILLRNNLRYFESLENLCLLVWAVSIELQIDVNSNFSRQAKTFSAIIEFQSLFRKFHTSQQNKFNFQPTSGPNSGPALHGKDKQNQSSKGHVTCTIKGIIGHKLKSSLPPPEI